MAWEEISARGPFVAAGGQGLASLPGQLCSAVGRWEDPRLGK